MKRIRENYEATVVSVTEKDDVLTISFESKEPIKRIIETLHRKRLVSSREESDGRNRRISLRNLSDLTLDAVKICLEGKIINVQAIYHSTNLISNVEKSPDKTTITLLDGPLNGTTYSFEKMGY